jgi:sulfonate transport system substrate-binding protein
MAADASAQEKILRAGYQKYGKLILLKTRGTLEKKLDAIGYKVSWTEFPSGPPLHSLPRLRRWRRCCPEVSV